MSDILQVQELRIHPGANIRDMPGAGIYLMAEPAPDRPVPVSGPRPPDGRQRRGQGGRR